jgi:hypothetical protein
MIWLQNKTVTVMDAKQVLTAPFFGGFIGFGSVGLIYAYKHAKEKGKVALGFIYVLGAYVGVEVLFWAIKR